MIKEFLGKKVAKRIDSSRIGATTVGKTLANYADADRRETKTYEGFKSVERELQHAYFRRRVIVVGLIVNLASWLLLIFLTRFVLSLVLLCGLIFAKGGLLLVLPAFSFTLLAMRALLLSWFPETLIDRTSEVMNSFHQQAESVRNWKIWVFACGVAAMNSIFLVAVYFYLTGEWQHYAK